MHKNRLAMLVLHVASRWAGSNLLTFLLFRDHEHFGNNLTYFIHKINSFHISGTYNLSYGDEFTIIHRRKPT